MLKSRLLHPQITAALARAGHGSKVLISDGNYPHGTKKGQNAEVVYLNLAPGQPIRPGEVYDSNAAILAAAVEEAGGRAKPLGIGPDDETVLSGLVGEGLATCDMVILSGGTSKGAGDLCYRAISSFNDPGIVVHGVALNRASRYAWRSPGANRSRSCPAFRPRRSSPFMNLWHR